MKFLKIACLAFVVLLMFACSKSTDKPASSTTIEGIWTGKYGTGNNEPSVFYSFNIKAGGVIEELDANGAVKGQGTWELENNILMATYSYLPPANNKFSVLGAFNVAQGRILGNWGYGESVTDGGTWEMTKKN
jgi:hypothetical protein